MGMNIDVVNVVERPEIHIIARSGSADCDQMAYSKSRVECLLEIDSSIKTQSGQPITDIVRFFHGDHPAQQFEAGNARGGNYPCVTFSTHRGLFDDLSYTYRQPAITLAHRQHFMLQGKVESDPWKASLKRICGVSFKLEFTEVASAGKNEQKRVAARVN